MRLRLYQRIVNSEIRSRREKLGLSQRKCAEAAGIPFHQLQILEVLRPWCKNTLEHLDRLATFFHVNKSTLYPEWARKVLPDIPTSRDIEQDATQEQLGYMVNALPAPSTEIKMSEKDAVSPTAILPYFLNVLTFRERKIIEMRYGLNGKSSTLQETSKIVGVSRERVRQIEKKAVRRMQYRKWLDDREKAKEGVHAENE